MRAYRSLLFVLMVFTVTAHARRLFLIELAKATVYKLSHLNKNAASWLQTNQKHAMAKWGEDFGWDGEADNGGSEMSTDSWFGYDEGAEAMGDGAPMYGGEPIYGGGDYVPEQPTYGGGDPYIQPNPWGHLGGLFSVLWMVAASIIGMICNIFIGIFGLFTQLIGLDISWLWGAILPAQTGFHRSATEFRQLPKAQQQAIAGLFVHTVTAFDTSLQKTLAKLHGQEAATKVELKYIEGLVQQPHQSGDHFVHKLRQQAPKLSAVVVTSYKQAAAAYRQRLNDLDQRAKAAIHKMTANMKTAQKHTANVLNAAPKARKAALKQVYHLMKNVHTLTHALI